MAITVAAFKPEPVFDLVKSMSKAEKRNFKLYATRLAGNQDAKFLLLFDTLDALDAYDEAKVLKRCPIKKEQIPNMKAHLYKQLLISLRLLNVSRNATFLLHEQLDFAAILYSKGLYKQSTKILDKAKECALGAYQHPIALEIIQFQQIISSLYINRSMADNAEATAKESAELAGQVIQNNDLSCIAIQLYSLHQKLGYVRSEKDLNMVNHYFKPRLDKYNEAQLSFIGKFYYYQSLVWYNYIQHDFLKCYRYARKWVELFRQNPQMKSLMYDNYLIGFARLLDGVFLMQHHKRLVDLLSEFEFEKNSLDENDENNIIIANIIYYYNKISLFYMEGTFEEGVKIVPEIEAFIQKYQQNIDLHKRMLFYYKIACLYFGNSDYTSCIIYLRRIVETRDPQVRRDLQCYARILNLISHYELGIDHNIDYQIKSVYAFLVKMNDLHEVQQEMIAFLKQLGSIYNTNFKAELINLYKRLKPYETHPYERRTFYYLDIISWLESKIQGVPVAQIIRQKFLKRNPN